MFKRGEFPGEIVYIFPSPSIEHQIESCGAWQLISHSLAVSFETPWSFLHSVLRPCWQCRQLVLPSSTDSMASLLQSIQIRYSGICYRNMYVFLASSLVMQISSWLLGNRWLGMRSLSLSMERELCSSAVRFTRSGVLQFNYLYGKSPKD